MEKSKGKLVVLGCVPSLLNILFELANESQGIDHFNIIQNIPVNFDEHYFKHESFSLNVVDLKKKKNTIEQFALSVVGGKSKEIVFNQSKAVLGFEKNQFINLIHPTAYVSKSTQLNYGLQIEPLSTIAACTKIGFAVNIKRNSNIGHHCNLKDYVTINPGVTISSFVTIGEKTMVGSGVTIKDGISIGSNTVIGVGSVVVKDIPDNCIAYGNPCEVKRIIV